MASPSTRPSRSWPGSQHPVTDPDEVPAYQVKEFAPRPDLGWLGESPSPWSPWPSATPGPATVTCWRSRGKRCLLRLDPVRPGPAGASGARIRRPDGDLPADAPATSSCCVRGWAACCTCCSRPGPSRWCPCYPGRSRVVRARRTWPSAAAGLGRDAALMTVHLTGTVPHGRASRSLSASTRSATCGAWRTCAVNDGSLLPSAPGREPAGHDHGGGPPQRRTDVGLCGE